MRCPQHAMVEMRVAIRNGPVIIYFCPQCNATKSVHRDELYKATNTAQTDVKEENDGEQQS